ncbi:hypothetical protein D3C71_874280 [compost metagenome]
MEVAHQGAVHDIVDSINLSGIPADEHVCHFGDTRSHPQGVRCNVVRAEGCRLAPAFKAGICANTHYRGVKTCVSTAARQLINAASVWQIYLINFNFNDLHKHSPVVAPIPVFPHNVFL